MTGHAPNIATALWAQHDEVRAARERLEKLRERVDSPGDLSPGQWAQLYAFILEFRPDLVIELGRGYGNSTCVFTEAANKLSRTRVVSVGYDAERGWATRTAPRVRELVGLDWFDCLEIREMDILDLDFGELTGSAQRVFLFWDAHGDDVATKILSEALPVLASEGRSTVIAVHDMSDARHDNPPRDYVRADGSRTYWQGYLVSSFEEVVPLFDFLSRNRIEYVTARGAFDSLREENPDRWTELTDALGTYSEPSPLHEGHWLTFELLQPAGDRLIFPAPESAAAADGAAA